VPARAFLASRQEAASYECGARAPRARCGRIWKAPRRPLSAPSLKLRLQHQTVAPFSMASSPAANARSKLVRVSMCYDLSNSIPLSQRLCLVLLPSNVYVYRDSRNAAHPGPVGFNGVEVSTVDTSRLRKLLSVRRRVRGFRRPPVRNSRCLAADSKTPTPVAISPKVVKRITRSGISRPRFRTSAAANGHVRRACRLLQHPHRYDAG